MLKNNNTQKQQTNSIWFGIGIQWKKRKEKKRKRKWVVKVRHIFLPSFSLTVFKIPTPYFLPHICLLIHFHFIVKFMNGKITVHSTSSSSTGNRKTITKEKEKKNIRCPFVKLIQKILILLLLLLSLLLVLLLPMLLFIYSVFTVFFNCFFFSPFLSSFWCYCCCSCLQRYWMLFVAIWYATII